MNAVRSAGSTSARWWLTHSRNPDFSLSAQIVMFEPSGAFSSA